MSGENLSYTTEEVAKLLKVSKLTVYHLIKKGMLPAYRIGRQMRIEAKDLEAFKERRKNEGGKGREREEFPIPKEKGNDEDKEGVQMERDSSRDHRKAFRLHELSGDRRNGPGLEEETGGLLKTDQVVISGQDLSLDLLARYIEKECPPYRSLRSYSGSLNSLMSMFAREADIVSTHLYDGETDEYNLPYIKRILTGYEYIVIHLVQRQIGFYVKKGNPKGITGWEDLRRKEVKLVNREKGSGARVFLDENLRLHGIPKREVRGYHWEETSHLSVAGAVAAGNADVGVGIEQTSFLFPVDFIPLRLERYDLVLLKKEENRKLLDGIRRILASPSFRQELEAMGSFDLSLTGRCLYETD
ncbi:substrate-binding domain-containing protein [Thermicanus aegyptius]|uniref:substrate-binding domain-containing protein n=1 Tax=Thermicanus aegyptius TaxID=94009 RepID=UPI0004901416|nr:helix-turn-helix transcriptional regulator [Thermicanus aegyptius]